jgi:cell division GTPase FtsZ
MNVIGLGQAGCNIADMLSEYPQYKIYKIDVESDFDFGSNTR